MTGAYKKMIRGGSAAAQGAERSAKKRTNRRTEKSIPCESDEKKKSGGLSAFLIRAVTAPPFVVLASFSLIFGLSDLFSGTANYLLLMSFIGFLPLLAYPLSYFVPQLRKKGRDGQRTLALILSVVGYLLGALLAFLFPSTGFEKVLASTYLFSGVLIALTSAVHFKSSGHAAGVAGPAFLLTWFMGWPFALSFLLLAAVFWSSLRLKRHTLPQLIVGSLIPITGVVLFWFLFM